MNPEKGNRAGQGTVAQILGGMDEGAGVVHPGKKKDVRMWMWY